MGGVVSMDVLQQAANAQVVVFAGVTVYHCALGKFSKACIASTLICNFLLFLLNLGLRNSLLFFNLWLFLDRSRLLGRLRRIKTLGCDRSNAVDDDTILHQTLQQPVVLTRARYTSVNAVDAQVVVTVVTDAAVVVLAGDATSAVVAVDAESVAVVVVVGESEREGLLLLLMDGRHG